MFHNLYAKARTAVAMHDIGRVELITSHEYLCVLIQLCWRYSTHWTQHFKQMCYRSKQLRACCPLYSVDREQLCHEGITLLAVTEVRCLGLCLLVILWYSPQYMRYTYSSSVVLPHAQLPCVHSKCSHSTCYLQQATDTCYASSYQMRSSLLLLQLCV
jgi:hypothetical protein